MKFVYPEIDRVFDTDRGKVNTLVLEHPLLMRRLLMDISLQLQGAEGKAVVSENESVLPTENHIEILDHFIPFEINRKNLITKACSLMEKQAVSGEYYGKTIQLLSSLKQLLDELAFELPGYLEFHKLDIGTLVRNAGPVFVTEETDLCGQLLDYMELVTVLDHQKLFLTVNLRCFISDREAEMLIDTILSHEYNVIMLEAFEWPRVKNEVRCIIDKDLCEIS